MLDDTPNHRWKLLMVVAMVGVGVLVLTQATAMGVIDPDGQLDAEATIVDVDTDAGGNITAIHLQVKNTGDDSFTPVLHVRSQTWTVPNVWPLHDTGDLPLLTPGETDVYRFEAPGKRAIIDPRGRFVVLLASSIEYNRLVLGPIEAEHVTNTTHD